MKWTWAIPAMAAILGGCSDAPATFQSNCVADAPTDEAKRPTGAVGDGSYILPGGRRIVPAGKVLTVGGFPIALRVLPDPRYAVVTDNSTGEEALRLVDLQAAGDAAVISQLPYSYTGNITDPALFFGLALTKDGKRLYVSNGGYDPVPATQMDLNQHYNVIDAIAIEGTPPSLRRLDDQQIHLAFNHRVQRYPAGLALSTDENTLYSANQGDGTLSVIDVRAGAGYGTEVGRTPELGILPYDVLLDGTRAYVSLWGGKLTGTTFTDGVAVVDLSVPNAPMPAAAPLSTGKSAEALVAVNGKIYVATADADAISVLDPQGGTATATPTALDDTGLYGSAPNSLAVDAARGRLYVANAGENAVQVFELSTMRSLGRIPSAWYPTAVAVLPDGRVLIASGKGLGGFPTDHSPGDSGLMKGVLQVVPLPSESELAAGDQTVRANLTRPRSLEVTLTCKGTPKCFPLPAEPGAPTPIEHVFLVVRENKTYDSELGDLATGNGKPDLVMWGPEITPNLHALATRFANLDNFYSNAEQSIQGHEWTTAATSNDYVEKSWTTAWGRGSRSIAAYSTLGTDLDHVALPLSHTIFTALDEKNIPYHNYGEAVNIGGAKYTLDLNYPGVFFGLGIPDVDKIQYVIDNLHDGKFKLEPFSYIGLPNDHTVGTRKGQPTPQSMIADNDEATGRFVDALSHSPYWKSSIVIVVEDDPSDGGDHVDLHRSPCVVASPWVKAGYTSSVHYDNPSMHRTITRLFGVGPMNAYDGNAAAMVDLFATTPDLRPYTFIPRKLPVMINPADAPLSAESAAIDFSRPDTAPLGRILWKAAKGRDAEPPWGKRPVGFTRDADD